MTRDKEGNLYKRRADCKRAGPIVLAEFEFFLFLLSVILRLRRIWRVADVHIGGTMDGAREILHD